MTYESKTPAELWSCALRGGIQDREMYFILSELVLKYKQHLSSTFFPPKSGPLLLDLLDKPHDPQLKIVVCTLVGYLCNVTSTAKEDLTNRGVIDMLLSIVDDPLAETDGGTAEQSLKKMLFFHVSAMLQFFSLGPEMCLRKMSITDAVRIINRLIDKDNPSTFWYDNAETLRSLVSGRLLVAEMFEMTPDAASTVFYQQLGYDFKSLFHISDSYVLDLYDTNGDDDVHVVDELDNRGSVMLYGSRKEEYEVDDLAKSSIVDVRVTHCVNAAYFWAVLGSENDERLRDFDLWLSARAAFQDLAGPPSVGKMVGAPKKLDSGLFRAQVLSVRKTDVTVFAIDYGYSDVFSVSELKAISHDTRFRSSGLAHLCKLMGVRRKLTCPDITLNLLHTLCNLTADLSKGMADRILSTNLLDNLNHLSTYTDVVVSTAVVQILNNMARNDALRLQFVKHGLLISVTGIVRRNMINISNEKYPNPECDQLIESCIAFFWNAMYNCPENKDELSKGGAIHLLTELSGADKPECVRQSALKALRAFVGKVAMTGYGSHRRAREDIFMSSDADRKSPSKSNSDSDEGITLKSMCLDSSLERAQKSLDTSGQLSHTIVDTVNEYALGEETLLRTSRDCELVLQAADEVFDKQTARLICGFLNQTNDGGSIYFGLTKKGVVKGQVMSHSDRDRFRLCIDKLSIKIISPSVVPGIIVTLFHPVLVAPSGSHVTDLFVIEIRIKPSLTSTLYGVKHSNDPKPFVRIGKDTIEMTAKDIYVWSVEVNEAAKLKELKQLQLEVMKLRELKELKQQHEFERRRKSTEKT